VSRLFTVLFLIERGSGGWDGFIGLKVVLGFYRSGGRLFRLQLYLELIEL
jgi:hypothetical protein